MKKIALLLTVMLAFMLGACAPIDPQDNTELPDGKVVEIELWSFPIGEWNESVSVPAILSAFNKAYPNIKVEMKPITYATGDEEIENALKNHTAPDIVFEGPERLVANWGERGLMADISDLFEGGMEIRPTIKDACKGKNGYNIYPICMTTHCMAINREMFERADALKFIDEEKHTWTTDGFISAVNALYNSGVKKVASVYCLDQAGDQGTRALVNNLYGGKFVNDAHTEYIVNSPENIRALETLKNLNGIEFDPTVGGGDTNTQFNNGELAMSFCWNVSVELTRIKNSVGSSFDVVPLSFPTDKGDPVLQGGIWGMGIFDNGDEDKIAAAKTFIRYIAEKRYEDAVLATGFLPVADGMNFYPNDDLRTEYGIFAQYLGDYYQISPNWTKARGEWWKMLRKVGSGEDVAQAVKTFDDNVNEKS